jgi:hypothetical protein
MFKSLAIAALLGLVQAQGKREPPVDLSGKTDEEKRGLDFMVGFFKGSSTIDLPPQKS